MSKKHRYRFGRDYRESYRPLMGYNAKGGFFWILDEIAWWHSRHH